MWTPNYGWAGDGPERGPAERLARELGVETAVTFPGQQDHVERLFPKAQVLLMPSETEAFGLAALEAMACGVSAGRYERRRCARIDHAWSRRLFGTDGRCDRAGGAGRGNC